MSNDDTGALCPKCNSIVKIALTDYNTVQSLYCGSGKCEWKMVWKQDKNGGFIKQ